MKLLFLLSLLAVSLARPLIAAEFCVSTINDWETALAFAGNNNQSDIIRVREGTYDVPAGGLTFSVTNALDNNHDLVISGGWRQFLGDPCGIRRPSAADTILDGNFSDRILRVDLPEQGDVTITGLSFVSGSAPGIAGGGGLLVRQDSNESFDGTLTISGNRFVNNDAYRGGGLEIRILEGLQPMSVQVLTNHFLLNQATSAFGGAALIEVFTPTQIRGEFIPPPRVILAHNTIVDNTAPANGPGGVQFIGDMDELFIASNNFWGNSTSDLTLNLVLDPFVVLRNNNIEQLGSSVVVPDIDVDNISVQPIYVDCGPFCFDRTPVTASPLIDAGLSPGVFEPWSLPAWDVLGRRRQLGEAVDIGAYEGTPDILFRDRFEGVEIPLGSPSPPRAQ